MSGFILRVPAWCERTVVGVVADVRYHDLGDVQLDIYDPALQVGRPADNVVDPDGAGDAWRRGERRPRASRANRTRR